MALFKDDIFLTIMQFFFRMMASYYESPINGCFYHLHREFVESITSLNEEDVEHATLCHSCYEALTVDKKIPTFSLALGVDFGNADRIGLLKLTLAEEYVIATARLFISIIKLAGYQHAERQSGKLGHAIVFPQYGSKLEEEIRKARTERHTGTFPCLDNIYDTLSIAFVGSNVEWAALVADKSHRIFKPIEVRSHVIYMWLAALKATNSRYRDIVIDSSKDMTEALDSVQQGLMDRKTIVAHDSEIAIDRLVHQQSKTQESMNMCDNDSPSDDSPPTYPMSFVTRSGCPDLNDTSAAASALKSKFDFIIYSNT